jgi:hypothetical protein
VLSACLPSASASPSPSSAIVSPTTIATSSPTPTTAAKRSPTPIPAERASDLVVRLEGQGDTGFPVALAVLTADGRFVTRTDDNQLRERRLTPAGVQRVRDELAATGLFERDQRVPLEVRPDATPPAHGIGALIFKVWRDTRIVEVQTATGQGAEEVYYQPSAARTRLDRLSKQLIGPETWLSADAWADPTPRPYEARAFALLLTTEIGPSNETQTIEALTETWPFSAGPLALGDPLPPTAGPQGQTTRCIALTRDDLLAVRDAISRAGGADATLIQPDGALFVGFASQDHQSRLVLTARPLFPDRASCNGEYAP